MTAKKTVRCSNIELFRCICMLFIIIGHFTIECGIQEFSGINKIFNFFGYWGGAAGNIGFICISAWWLDRFRFSGNKIGRIIWKTTLYSIIIWLLAALTVHPNFEITKVLQSFLPVIYGGYEYITIFVIVYFMSPMLKRILGQIEKKTQQKLIVVSGILLMTVPFVFLGSPRFTNYFTSFIFLYIVVDYLKKYEKDRTQDKVFLAKVTGISWGIMIVFSIILLVLKNYISYLKPYSSLWASGTGVLMMSAMGSLFFLFLNWEIPYSRIINWIGGCTLGVFLLHAAPATRNFIWIKLFHTDTWGMSKLFPIKMLGCCVLMYVICLLIESILRVILGKIPTPGQRVLKKLEHWMNELEE